MPARRSVVKIKNVCTGTAGTAYSNSNTKVGTWATGVTSADACVVQYTALNNNALTISAMAIDGADSLWVRRASLSSVYSAPWMLICICRGACLDFIVA